MFMEHKASLRVPGTTSAHVRNDTVNNILADGCPYSTKLSAHSACVNVLAFSSRDARFLASGGDDLKICLWDFHQDNLREPSVSLKGQRGNIFTLAFSCSDHYLYSGGTDETLVQYDISYLGSNPNEVSSSRRRFRDHKDTIRGISCHSFRDEIFLSASQDGRVIIHDIRTQQTRENRAENTIQLPAEATSVQFHPVQEHIFATSDSHGNVCLRDARMSFGPLMARTSQGVVQNYNTKLSKRRLSYLSNPEASSICFDREGTRIAVSLLHYLPVIYGISDPNPIAVCAARNRPDGSPVPRTERSFSDSCTIKHGSFGSAGHGTDELFSAGSEDFRGYVWKIPSVAELTSQRLEISADDWNAHQPPSMIAFAEGLKHPRYVPLELGTPFFRLTGHRSIVNTTLIHPDLPYILTSGIERDIILHSPKSSAPFCESMTLTPTDVRIPNESDPVSLEAYTIALFDMEDMENTRMSEELTIQMFDQLIREQGNLDPFLRRRWKGNKKTSIKKIYYSSEEEEEEEEEEDEEEEDERSDSEDML